MKLLNYFTLLILLSLFGFNLDLQGAYYSFTSNTGNNATVIIDRTFNPRIGEDPLVTGMEVGVFTPGGLCVGSGLWPATGNLSITVWGDDSETPAVDGAVIGQTLSYRVYDPVGLVEYTSVAVGYQFGPTTYQVNGISLINSFVAAKKPGKPGFTNPTNNANGVALSGTLSITAGAGATTHTIQLSTSNTFTPTLVNANGNITSAAYSGLANNTTYYARARGTNSEGDGDWETISFKTLLGTPTLVSPANNAKGLNESSVNLSWNSVAGATSYRVQYADNPAFNNFTLVNVASTSTVLSGLNNFTNYYWMVQAVDGANTSPYTPSRTFQTRVGTTTITAPANNAVGVASSGTIQWNAVTGATSYDVQLIKSPATVILSQNVVGTSLAFSNLENFTNYTINVTAKNVDGTGALATSTFRTILGVPSLSTPTNNSFNNPLAGNLTWTSVTGATTYDLRVATDAAFTNVIITQNDIATTSYAYSGLVNNQKYYWYVRAKNAEGTGSFSSSFGFTTVLGTVVLASPANNATQVALDPTLTWTALAGATVYHVQVSTNPAFSSFVYENENLAATSIGLTNLNGKTNYYFRVKGKNQNNSGDFSAANMFTTVLAKVVLSSPANNAQGIVAASGTLSWVSQAGVTGYDLLVSKNIDLSLPVVNTSTVGASYNYTTLDNNTTYYWAVRSKDNEGTGPWSNTWSFGTQIPAPTLLTPLNTATNVALVGNATWSAVAGATSYELQIATDAEFNNILFSQTGIVGTTGAYEDLLNNALHYWRVRAYKNEGAGFWSSTFTFTTMSLASPTLVYPPNNAIDLFTQASFTWNSVNDAISYNVRIATDPNFINVIHLGTNIQATNWQAGSFLTDRSYFWQVQTVGQQGVSNWSNTFTFKTYKPIPEFTGSEEPCENKTSVYTTHVSPLVDYQWTVVGGVIVGSSTSNSVVIEWGNAGSGSVKLTRTSAAWGNYTDNKTLNVVKEAVEEVDITLSANTYYVENACLNEPVAFNAAINSNGIFDYTWKLGNTVLGTSPSLTHTFNTAGTFTLVFTAVGQACEGGQESITIVVSDDCPITVLNAATVYTCKNTPVLLSNIVFGGSGDFSYLWSQVTDFLAYSGVPENMKNKVLNPLVKGLSISKSVALTVTDNQTNEQLVDMVYISILNAPNFTFSPSSLIIRNNNPLDLTDGSITTITVSGGTAPYTYTWEDNNGNPLDDPTNIVLTTAGTNRYNLTVTDANGCPSTTRRLTLLRSNNKEIGDDIVAGLSGAGYIMTYPNPVTDELNIFADFDEKDNARLKVLNLLGQEVFSLNLGTVSEYDGSINLSHLTTGSYTLVIETNMNTFVKPFIKQ